jgi:hypothetical protein
MELRKEHMGMENIRTVPLARTTTYVIVDAEDYDRVCKFKWYVDKNGQGRVSGARCTRTKSNSAPQKNMKMHRLIMQVYDPKICIDHINRDVFDNRKDNLRICTKAENNKNSRGSISSVSGFKGVRKIKNRWMARIDNEGHCHYIGSYKSLAHAVYAYDAKATELHGACAWTNKMLKPDHDFFTNPEAYK